MSDPAAPASTDAVTSADTPAADPGNRAGGGTGGVADMIDRHKHRFVALLVLLATGTVLAIATGLTPDDRGFGTHQSMGLSPCGFKAATRLPCLTCGMTTSFTHAAEGDLISALAVQPTGTLFAILTAMAAVVSALALVFGFSLAPLWNALARPRTLLVFGALLLAGWLYTMTITIMP